MIEQVCITDSKGPRFYAHGNFPISIGTDSGYDLEVSSEQRKSNPAFLIIIVNRAYIDMERSKLDISINDEPVKGQKEIQHDDILEIEGVVFHCEHIGNILSISLYEDDSYLVSRNEAIASDGELIEPIIPQEIRVEKKPPRRLLRLFSFFGILLFGLLAVVLAYVFTAKTLIIDIEPPPDRMALHGQIWPIKIRDRYLVQPGSYSIEAEKKGYRNFEKLIKVSKHHSQSFTFTLEKNPGQLVINSEPAENVKVVLDGESYGSTPIKPIELEAGTYSLQASADRYQDFSTQIVIEGKDIKQNLDINLLPNWKSVLINSDPTGAAIWLNGENKGITPQTLELDAGLYSLELLHNDYLPYIKEFAVDANQEVDLAVAELFTNPSHLVITSIPSKATVTIDNIEQGVTPFTLRLNPNTEHNITLSKEGYKNNLQKVLLKPGEQKNLSASLEAILGTIVLNIDPNDAEVFINGKFMGSGNVKLSLASARQRLEIRKSGYQVYEKMISPTPGTPQVFDINLSRISSASDTSKHKTIRTSEGHELKLIFAGKFSMGAPRREQGRRSNETLHSVELRKPFYVATYEVSNQQFAVFKPSHSSGNFKGHSLANGNHPVVNITWDEAAAYCNWLSQKEGLESVYKQKDGKFIAKNPIPSGYRLLTESEWEWVARIQSNNKMNRYAWGNQFPPKKIAGNYADESASEILEPVISDYNDGYVTSSPIGSFAANHFGIYDLGGNVAEWCHDYHSIYPSLSDEVFVDPLGPASNEAIDGKHVIRGASWMRGDLSNTRLSYRDRDHSKRPDVGFRIAKYLD